MSESYTHDEKEEVSVVWSLPAGEEGMPVSQVDDLNIAGCVRQGVSGYAGEYFLTESDALDALRKHAKEQEQKWYALIRQIDARVDEIEIAEVGEENHGS